MAEMPMLPVSYISACLAASVREAWLKHIHTETLHDKVKNIAQ